MSDELKSLLERVESATVRLDDRTLTELICAVRGWNLDRWEIGCGGDGSREMVIVADGGRAWFTEYRHLCPDASVDGALELIEQVLPGCNRQMCDGEPYHNPWAKLSPLRGGGRRPSEGQGATLPLALLSGLLRVMVADDAAASRSASK